MTEFTTASGTDLRWCVLRNFFQPVNSKYGVAEYPVSVSRGGAGRNDRFWNMQAERDHQLCRLFYRRRITASEVAASINIVTLTALPGADMTALVSSGEITGLYPAGWNGARYSRRAGDRCRDPASGVSLGSVRSLWRRRRWRYGRNEIRRWLKAADADISTERVSGALSALRLNYGTRRAVSMVLRVSLT